MDIKQKNHENIPEIDGWVFCKQYTNRWGKLMIAEKYGYKYWKFPVKSKRNHN